MRSTYLKATLKAAILAASVLLLKGAISPAQTVNLTASQQTSTLTDGNTVPMWGWTCGTITPGAGGTPSCTALTFNPAAGSHNPQAGGTTWQPPLIVIPVASGTTASLTINLTNNLPVETSIVIIGQVSSSATTTNGGLGVPVREAGPRTDGAHGGQTSTTWTTVLPGSFTPPSQGDRVRSFVPEVNGVATVGATPAVGIYTWTGLKPGTYLMRTGTYPSIQGPMGLYGVLVVTTPPVTGTPGLAYPVTGSAAGGVTYDADVVALESEIDPRQNKMVAALFPTGGTAGSATANAGFSETAKWTPACNLPTNTTPATCYPPAVDYTPLYFLINGLVFSADNQAASALSVPATAMTGNVLVRYVNAGSHMHVPTFVGLNMLLVAEDGYVLPDVALALTKGKTLTANPPAITSTTGTQAVGLQVRNEVFQAAGKVMDVIVSPAQSAAGTYATNTYFTFDRSLALSTNGQHGVGMQATLDVNDSNAANLSLRNTIAVANPDKYGYAPGTTLTISDPGKGVIANDVNVYGVQLVTPATAGTVTLFPNGTFTYAPTGTGADSFGYCANGTTLASTTPVCTTVTLNLSATANSANAPLAYPDAYSSTVASLVRVPAPGVLQNDVDPNGYPMTAALVTKAQAFLTVYLNPDGSLTVTKPASSICPAAGCTFTYQAKNSQGILSNTATVTLNFPTPSNLTVHVQDATTHQPITDYKWIIEQDLTLPINPACQINTGTTTPPVGCPVLPAGSRVPLTPATQFHASYYPVIAEGCTGPQSCEQGQTVYDNNPASPTYQQHVQAACDGYGICNTALRQLPVSTPAQAHLAATNPDGSPGSYYISILSGDSQNAFAYANTKDPSITGNCTPGVNGTPGTEPTGITESSACGHTMGGAPIPASACSPATGTCSGSVTINLQQAPLKTATVTAFIFEDDYPLNGEPDTGGGVDSLATLEVPLGDFQIEIWDDAGGVGDFTGQMTYDMFNMPLTNALNGTIDPNTGSDACPISNTAGVAVGVIIACPQYEADGKTLSPLTGQVVVKNLMQGKFSLIAHPSAVREANGEEWLQTNSLDGGHFLDSFLRVGEPPYFQEVGPGGYHVFFGFANPKIINARLASICGGTTDPNIPFSGPCTASVHGQVTNLHQGRSPSEQLYSGAVFAQGDPRNYAMLGYTNCYAALGDSDGATIALTKCDPNGNFSFPNLPAGNYGLVLFDQWDDLIVDGSSHAINLATGQSLSLVIPSFTWQAHLWNRAYVDVGLKGRPVLTPDGNLDPVLSPGLIQVPVRIRQRNGKFVNTLLSDVSGNIHFDETFPLFAFYTVESDTTRFRSTGVHVVNDNGGQVDGPAPTGNGVLSAYQGILNSKETIPLPSNLSVPGAVYCGKADCTDRDLSTNPTGFPSGPGVSTGRIDPGNVTVEGWQGGVSEFDIIDWGKTPYIPGENGGIRGHVVNSTTRPFDDPRMLFQNLWEPLVPNVTINLYQEGTAPDGSTSLTLVDTTLTSSWDSWAQGFNPATGLPYMSCTGQDPTDPFFSYTMQGTTNYLFPNTALPNGSQYKCYDGYHNLNQLQPAPYDGLYQFPSQTCLTPGATFTVAGNPTVYHCVTIANPATGQAGAATAVLPSSATCATNTSLKCTGRYVTEVVLPPGWQLNKEEDLNLLIGDQYIAPVTQQFPLGLGNIFIVPDQAAINSINPSYTGPYTAANPYNQPFAGGGFTANTTNNGSPSTDWGRTSFGDFGPGGLIIQSAPCVGLMRVVPDFLSISPESGEVAPFAGSTRPLCDRKEVTLDDQMQANAEFFIYTMTPKATTFTGFISDDFSSEFDPASPAFGEKFAIPNVPVSIKDFNGQEISRLYSDQFGTFNGLVYSTWEVDPPNITGYSPNMMITCMNDPGPIPGPGGTMVNDPYFNPAYTTFCYENPFMPGDATYLDTPVVPVSAFAEGYNPPDCAYPDGTPMIKSVTGTAVAGGSGPYIASQTSSFTITAGGDASGNQMVPNPGYSGPAATTAPYNQKFISRHYGFGANAKVTVGGVPATCTNGDLSMTCTLPATPSVPLCNAANPTYTGANATARCGQVVVTSTNGKQSVDTVTLTIGGKAPTTYIAGENASGNAIQSAIDTAAPGDLILVGPGTYQEMLLMWKPVRLQGVGDGAVSVSASTFPAGILLDPWRRRVNCLFGLALNGGFSTGNNTAPGTGGGTNPYDPNFNGNIATAGTQGNGFYCDPTMQNSVDPIPGEPVVGWDATLNGNIAELLQEPTLMGAYEGAAITILAKGLENNNSTNCNPEGAAGCVPLNGCPLYARTNAAGGVVCTSNASAPSVAGDCNASLNPQFYRSNFLCNPSRIDGITFTNSSQGGGGIFLHGWDHYLEVSNNHSFGNGGTLSGGIIVGQPETIDPTLGGSTGTVAQPELVDQHVYVHNNSVTLNAAYGDELNSNTPASAGGVVFCTGSDYYLFQYNWVCGNLSTGNGGGLAHYGFSYNGDIEHNSFVFNQSINPTLTTHGGGVIVGGQAPDGAACENAAIDFDCPPALSDGAGPGLVINANMFQGNTAEEGSGGGLRLQFVNGNDVLNNPNDSSQWYRATVTNNIFVGNVAGWLGGGVSMIDAVRVDFTNNTVVSNDSTASAGVLFDSLGAPGADVPPPGCNPTTNPNCTGFQITTSSFQPAGLSTEKHTPNLLAAFTVSTVTCPDGRHAQCTQFSDPGLDNNIFWQNRSFHIVDNPSVALLPQLSQATTGACTYTTGSANFWDIGVYGDTGPGNHSSGLTLAPTYSILDDPADYTAANAHNMAGTATTVTAQYCNGSRVPPEIAPLLCTSTANAPGCIQPGTVGIQVPAGVPDSLVPPLPVFSLAPTATVDEGSNWINMFYGPLSMTNPTILTGTTGYGVPLSNPAPGTNSPALDAIPVSPATLPVASQPTLAFDFFGNPRPDPGNTGHFDIGAIEVAAAAQPAIASVTGGPLAFGNVAANTTSASQQLVLHNTGGSALTGITLTFTGPYNRAVLGGNCSATLAAGATCTINVVFHPTTTGSALGSLSITASVTVVGSPVSLTGTGVPQGTLAFTLGAGTTTGVTLTTISGVPTLNFGTQAAGTTTTAVLTVTNSGGSTTFTTVTERGGAGHFVKTADTCSATTLAAGGVCSITVTFTPNNTTLRVGSLTVADNASGNPQTLGLRGN